MDTKITPATKLTRAVAAGQADAFDQAVTAAYAAGATSDDLRRAVELGERLGDVPGSVVTRAYLTVYYWSCMAARSGLPRHAPASQAAQSPTHEAISSLDATNIRFAASNG